MNNNLQSAMVLSPRTLCEIFSNFKFVLDINLPEKLEPHEDGLISIDDIWAHTWSSCKAYQLSPEFFGRRSQARANELNLPEGLYFSMKNVEKKQQFHCIIFALYTLVSNLNSFQFTNFYGIKKDYGLESRSSGNWSTSCNTLYQTMGEYFKWMLPIIPNTGKGRALFIFSVFYEDLIYKVFENTYKSKSLLDSVRIDDLYEKTLGTKISSIAVNKVNTVREAYFEFRSVLQSSFVWKNVKGVDNEKYPRAGQLLAQYQVRHYFYTDLIPTISDLFKELLQDTGDCQKTFSEIEHLLSLSRYLPDVFSRKYFLETAINSRFNEHMDQNYYENIRPKDNFNIGKSFNQIPKLNPLQQSELWKSLFPEYIAYLSHFTYPILEQHFLLTLLENYNYNYDDIVRILSEYIESNLFEQNFKQILDEIKNDLGPNPRGENNNAIPNKAEQKLDSKIFVTILHSLFSSKSLEFLTPTFLNEKYFSLKSDDHKLSTIYAQQIHAARIMGNIKKCSLSIL